MSTMPTPAEALQFMSDAQLYQRIDLTGAWSGWKVRGQHLVSPDGQRISPERFRGLLWRDEMELRRAGFASRRRAENGTRGSQYGPKVKVVVIDLQEYLQHGVSAA